MSVHGIHNTINWPQQIATKSPTSISSTPYKTVVRLNALSDAIASYGQDPSSISPLSSRARQQQQSPNNNSTQLTANSTNSITATDDNANTPLQAL